MPLFNLVGIVLLITHNGLCYVHYGTLPPPPSPLSALQATGDDIYTNMNMNMNGGDSGLRTPPVAADSYNLLGENQNLDSEEKAQLLISAQANLPQLSDSLDIFNKDTANFQLPRAEISGETLLNIKKAFEEYKEENEIDLKTEMLKRLMQNMPDGPLPIVYIEDETLAAQEMNGDQLNPLAPPISAGKRSRYYRRYPWKRQNSRYRTLRLNSLHGASHGCVPTVGNCKPVINMATKSAGGDPDDHNNIRYEPDTKYMCVPSRKDVMQLLLNIHEQRNGVNQKDVSFCNRKRPAKAIFTNIRFLG